MKNLRFSTGPTAFLLGDYGCLRKNSWAVVFYFGFRPENELFYYTNVVFFDHSLATERRLELVIAKTWVEINLPKCIVN